MFEKGKKDNIRIILLTIAVLLWMGLIFHFSAQPAIQSDGLSKNITKGLVITGQKIGIVTQAKNTDKFFINQMNDVIRSYAHFFMFFVLGFLTYWSVFCFKKRNLIFVPSFIFCAVYAALDEFHQYFVPGRAVQLSDFIIDCFGSALGIILFIFLSNVYGKYRSKSGV